MRVVVVEDDQTILTYLVRHLRNEGYAVDSASTGRQALDLARNRSYDVMTLDILLPDINGYEVCRTLREEGVSTPILMLTANDGDYDEADALNMGADEFLRKPFSLVVLDARLRALIRRSAHMSNRVLQTHDLTLNPTTHEVTRAGDAIKLTQREFSLLECLMYACGRVLTKEYLLAHVWGQEHPLSNNVVEVYVGYLRKKVDAGHATKLITTVRGAGYRIERG